MTDTFTAVIKDFAAKTKQQIRNVMRESVQDVIDEAQTPKSQGGRMPIDTGFLINSVVSGLNGSFSPSSGKEDASGSASIASYTLTIANMDLGDVAQFGWAAHYAMIQEVGNSKIVGNHFAGSAAAKWPQFVEANVARLK